MVIDYMKSVIITTYNRHKIYDIIVKKLLSQTVKAHEVIVLNDNP